MMRSTNFIVPRRRPVRLISALFWSLGLGGLALGSWAFIETREVMAATDKLRGHLTFETRVQASDSDAGVPVPSGEELAQLRDRIEFYNNLTGPRRASAETLLATLEGVVPDGVWIRTLSYDATNGRFSFSLLSEDGTLLPNTLQRIEEVPRLGSVILERQLRVRQGQTILEQYDVRGEARE